MGKEKKGKLRSALKKVFCCFFPMASSKPKGSPDEDVYEPLNGQTGSVPTSLSKETEKVSATEPQKPKKSFFARLKAKKSKKMLPAQPKTAALLGGAAVMLASGLSDDSDEVYLPAAQRTATTLENHFEWQMMHAPSFTSVETFYSSEDDLYSSEYEVDGVSGDFHEDDDASFINSSKYTSPGLLVRRPDPEVVSGLLPLQILSVFGDVSLIDVEDEDSDEFTQEEILQLIQCSNDPPNHKQKNGHYGQDLFSDQVVNVNYMGFPNIGNTCYMNSTLQCFFSIQPIMEDIIFQESRWKNAPGSEMLRTFYDLHFARLNRGQNTQRTQQLAAVKRCIAMRNPDFAGNYQQDAHEFLMTLMDQLKDEAEMCQESEKTFRNPVAHLEFSVKRMRTCETCGNQSCSTEKVNCLSLVIAPQKSLIESLQQYFASSQLECRCDKCQGTEASESVEIQTLPKVLVLLVTRFDMFNARKIKGCLNVPEQLSLSSFTGSDSCEREAEDTQHSQIETKQQQADTTYELKGVVSHYGSTLHCGHYVSNIRDPYGAQWLSCDDDTVKSVKWSNVSKTIENHGYMFFYVRRYLGTPVPACYEDFRSPNPCQDIRNIS